MLYSKIKALILLVRDEQPIHPEDYAGLTAEQAEELANRLSPKVWEICSDCGTVTTEDLTSTHDVGEVCPTCLAEKYALCPHCDEYHANETEWLYVETAYGTEHWCKPCAERDSFVCLDCGERYSDDTERHTIGPGDHICQSCYEDNWFTCERCGAVEHTDDSCSVPTPHGSQTWCTECRDSHTWECGSCRETVSNSMGSTTRNDGEEICHDCYSEAHFTCDRCDGVFHEECYGDDGLCQSCDEDRNRHNVIQNYSARAQDQLAWGCPESRRRVKPGYVEPLYFGMELEVEVVNTSRGEAAYDLLEHCRQELNRDRLILCEDGSLNDGFEIKTPPMSAFELKAVAEAICSTPGRRHLRSHDGGRCGLHVHITRAAMTQMQQGKLYEFVNNPANKSLVKAIARRYQDANASGNRYALINADAKKKHVKRAWHIDHSGGKKKVLSKNGEVEDGRYVAVNFTRETVELRLVRGTLKQSTLLACIDWIAALVCFTRTGEVNAGRGETAAEFLAWLSQHPERNSRWKHLTKFLVEHQFLGKHVLPNPRPLLVGPPREAIEPPRPVADIAAFEALPQSVQNQLRQLSDVSDVLDSSCSSGHEIIRFNTIVHNEREKVEATVVHSSGVAILSSALCIMLRNTSEYCEWADSDDGSNYDQIVALNQIIHNLLQVSGQAREVFDEVYDNLTDDLRRQVHALKGYALLKDYYCAGEAAPSALISLFKAQVKRRAGGDTVDIDPLEKYLILTEPQFAQLPEVARDRIKASAAWAAQEGTDIRPDLWDLIRREHEYFTNPRIDASAYHGLPVDLRERIRQSEEFSTLYAAAVGRRVYEQYDAVNQLIYRLRDQQPVEGAEDESPGGQNARTGDEAGYPRVHSTVNTVYNTTERLAYLVSHTLSA